MHCLVWGNAHSLALLLLMSGAFLPLRAKKACRTRIGCRVCGRKLAAEPGEPGWLVVGGWGTGAACMRRTYSWGASGILGEGFL